MLTIKELEELGQKYGLDIEVIPNLMDLVAEILQIMSNKLYLEVKETQWTKK